MYTYINKFGLYKIEETTSLTVARNERERNVLTHASLMGIIFNSYGATVRKERLNFN